MNHLKTIKSFYETDQNKYLFYHISLFLWVFVLILTISILSLNSYNPNRATFYVPLILFIIMLYLSTHWLIICAYKAFIIIELNKNIIQMPESIDIQKMENDGNREDHSITDI